MTWNQIQPGLPRAGLAGSLDPEDFAEGFILELLQDPNLVLRPPGAWVPAPSRARVWVDSDAEWDTIVDQLLQLGLVEVCDDLLLSAEGLEVSNGAFGVEKQGEMVDGGSLAVLRLIINLIPANAAQICVGGDTEGLPSQLQWAFFTLLELEYAVFS